MPTGSWTRRSSGGAIHPDRTALVSIMWANNETGLVFPIKELATLCRDKGILFHTDAVQAIGKIPVDVQDVPVDFLSFSAHKFHGPKGVGGPVRPRRASRSPRFCTAASRWAAGAPAPSMSPVLVGMGLAMELAVDGLPYEQRMCARCATAWRRPILSIPGIVGHRQPRSCGPRTPSSRASTGVEGEAMIWDLNRQGMSCSTGSACASESLEPNPTLVAMSVSNDLIHTGVRLSLSRFTTGEDIDRHDRGGARFGSAACAPFRPARWRYDGKERENVWQRPTWSAGRSGKATRAR